MGKPSPERSSERRHGLVTTVAVFVLVVAACGQSSDGPTPVTETPTTEPGNQPEAGPSSPPPDTDTSISIVALADVHFDTFDGGSVTLADSTPELRSHLLDAIPPIDDPVYGDVSTGNWMVATDRVLGYVAGDQAYAYPFKILNFHEIVNDVVGGIPVLISYCPLCGSAIVYDRRVGGDTHEFRNTSALYESDMVMVDRATGSYWWQVAGSAIVGPQSGATLEVLPSSVATWADWVSVYPDTLVLTRETGFTRPYEQDSFADYSDYLDGGNFAFPVGDTAADRRLSPSAVVVGVRDGETVRVYPIEDIADPINDVVDRVRVVILPTADGAGVFLREADGTALEFERAGDVFVDTATGTTWSAGGTALSGRLQGTQLAAVPARTTFWFAMVGAFPDLVVHQPEG